MAAGPGAGRAGSARWEQPARAYEPSWVALRGRIIRRDRAGDARALAGRRLRAEAVGMGGGPRRAGQPARMVRSPCGPLESAPVAPSAGALRYRLTRRTTARTPRGGGEGRSRWPR